MLLNNHQIFIYRIQITIKHLSDLIVNLKALDQEVWTQINTWWGILKIDTNKVEEVKAMEHLWLIMFLMWYVIKRDRIRQLSWGLILFRKNSWLMMCYTNQKRGLFHLLQELKNYQIAPKTLWILRKFREMNFIRNSYYLENTNQE